MSSSRYRRRLAGVVAGIVAASMALAACGSSDSGSSTTSSAATTAAQTTSAEATSSAPASPSPESSPASSASSPESSPESSPAGTDATTSGSGAPEQGVDDGTKLTLWTRAPLEKQAKALVEAYNSSHKNQVELTIVPNDDYVAKVGAAAGSNGLPDLFAADIVYVPNWVDAGLFTDITTQIDGLPYAADLNPGHITAGTKDDKKYVMPFVIDASVLMWNKALYKEAGLDPDKGPTTVAEFVEQAKAVAALKKDGVTGTSFGGNCGGCLVFTWFPMLWASDTEVMNPEGTESLLASDQAKQVYAAWKSLVDTPNGVAAGSKEETGPTWVAGFQEGKVGVMPYPATLLSTADEALGKDNVGVAALPGLTGGGSSFAGGDGIGISKDSKVADQAWNFMAWLSSDDAQVEVIAKGGDVPIRADLSDNKYAQQDPRVVAINQAAAGGDTPVAMNFQEAFNAGGSPWVTLVQNAVFGDASSIDADNKEITAVLGG